MKVFLRTGLVLVLMVTPAWAVWSDNFDSYGVGGLDPSGNPPWVGAPGATTGAIDVTNNVSNSPNNSVLITGGPGGVTATNDIADIGTPLITAGFKIRYGAGGGTTMWSVHFDAPGALNLARFYTNSNTIRGRIDGFGQVTTPLNLSGVGIWDDARIEIDTVNKLSHFYFNNVEMPGSPLGYAVNQPAITGVLDKVRIERVTNTADGSQLYLDDMYATPEPATLVLLVLGGLCLRRHRTV